MNTIKVKNIAELKTRKGTLESTVEVLGYYTEGDGGGGTFYWDNTSTETDNGGTILSVSTVSVGRWKRKIENDFINIREFGCKSDGTNNSSILQVLIDYCSTNKKQILIPEGTFTTTTQLNLKTNTYIIGTGETSILYSTEDNTFFRADTINNVSISNLQLKGDVGGSLLGGIGFQFLYSNNIKIEKVSLIDLSYDGIDFYQSSNFSIINNYISNTYGNGITIRNGCDNFLVKNNKIISVGREGGNSLGKGISVSCQNSLPNLGCTNGIIDSNYIKNSNQIGIELFTTFDLVDAARNKSISISNNKVIQTTAASGFKFGISIAGSDNCTGSNNYSENCVIGFEIADSKYCSYVNNIAIGSTYSAYTITGNTVSPVHINLIGNTSKNTTGDRSILVTNVAKYLNIQSNNIDVNSGRGLELVNTDNNYIYTTITNNIISNSQKSGIYIADAKGVTIKDNIVFGNNLSVTAGEDDIYLNMTNAQILTCFIKDNIKTVETDYTTTVTSKVIGGTQTTSNITYQTTTGVGTTGADHIFKVGNNGNKTALRILNNGSIGIGTDAPHNYGADYNILQVAGAGGFGGFIQVTDSTGSGGVLEMYGGSGDCQFGTRTNTDLKLKTNDLEKARLKSTGEFVIGGDLSSSTAIFELISTVKGMLVPRMTTTQKNAISSPANGLMVYDATLNKLCIYESSTWRTVTTS